ncbi:hypothetical protein D3C71_2076740 [compost metagenome]
MLKSSRFLLLNSRSSASLRVVMSPERAKVMTRNPEDKRVVTQTTRRNSSQ